MANASISNDLLGLGRSPIQESESTFPDGARYRIEIASVESPDIVRAVVAEAAAQGVAVARVSQGSGMNMLTDREIVEMLEVAESGGIDEVCLFLSPRTSWDIGLGAAGGASSSVRGTEGVLACVAEARRAARLGCRSLLVGDLGVLASLATLRKAGDLPPDLRFKTSASLAPANPAVVRLYEALGADTINVAGDLDVHQLAEIRGATSAPIDIYVESPDDVGGYVRHHEVNRIVKVAAPVYLKYGLRGAVSVYPVGYHRHSVAVDQAREKVRRAALSLQELARQEADEH